MIAVDTSSFVAYLGGIQGKDVEILDEALAQKQVVFPPMVLTELLSDPKLSPALIELILQVPELPLTDGFWQRAGKLRAKILQKKYKARLADALISQICLDHDVALITRDKDFRHYASIASLSLLP